MTQTGALNEVTDRTISGTASGTSTGTATSIAGEIPPDTASWTTISTGSPTGDDPPRRAEGPDGRARATRAQRVGAVIALLVAVWLALQLFASVLLPVG